VSLSREWLGFSGDRSPERATSGKQQRERIADLAAACSRKIATEILPALRARATSVLGDKGWFIIIDPDDSQTLHFTYPSDIGATTPDTYVRREVKIECGARSDDCPAEDKSVVPYVAELYPESLSDAVAPLRVLSIERTFWEKATILHAEAHRDEAKATPRRFSRHYADLVALADHPSAAVALARDELRARVVEHKRVFFTAAWAKYETAVPGTFRLIPPPYRLASLEADYRDMQEMFFGRPTSWPDIVGKLRVLEAQINRH
jgi:hypothetical protein